MIGKTLMWISRGIFIGALVGGVFMADLGYLLGGLMGSLASLTSLGNPELVRSEAFRLASQGVVFGIMVGALIGGLIGAFGNVRAVTIAATVGAVSLALGGATFGSITSNDNPVDWTKVILFSVIGACLGALAGAFIGWVASPLDRYLFEKLQRTA
jgi:hypothetical protein